MEYTLTIDEEAKVLTVVKPDSTAPEDAEVVGTFTHHSESEPETGGYGISTSHAMITHIADLLLRVKGIGSTKWYRIDMI